MTCFPFEQVEGFQDFSYAMEGKEAGIHGYDRL